MDYTANYKVILLGEVGVGKTSLFNRIKTGTFSDTQSSSTGVCDCYQHLTTVDKDKIVVSLWDTAGLERYRSAGSPLYSHYRRATGALLVYSVNDPYSFETLQQWMAEAKHFVEPQFFKWALIGNKCDLHNVVESTRVEARREQLQTTLSYTVSAKTGHNVMKAFNSLIAAIHRDNKQEHNSTILHSSIHLNDSTASVLKSSSCCN